MEVVSLRSLGQNKFAARLPICLATFAWFVATAMLAYECTRDQLTSLASAVILATFFGTFQFSHLVMPEPVFGFLMTVSFWLLVRLAKRFPGEKLQPELFLLWTSMAASLLCLRANRRLSSRALLPLLLFFIYAIAISFANLQDYYLLICLPVIAIWLAWSLRQRVPPVFSAWFPGIFLILLGIGGLVLSNLQLTQLFSPSEGGRGEQPAINSVASALVNVVGATGRTLSNVLLLFGICAIIVGLLIVLFRRQPLAPVILLPPFVLLTCLLGIAAEVALQDYLSSASIASAIERNSDQNTLIASKGDISDRTSLYFYLPRQLHWLGGEPAQEYAARRYGTGGDLYLKTPELVSAWHSERKVCIILDNRSLSSLAAALKIDPRAVQS